MFRRILHRQVVITAKKDKSFKISLDSKELNAIHKNKYQMQSIDHLIDEVASYVSERRNTKWNILLFKNRLKIRILSITIRPSTTKTLQFQHNIVGGKATRTYRFLNGFYGLTDMPATFQKTIDVTLQNCHNKFAFLDEILVKTKGNLTDHEKEIDKELYQLDKENLAIKLKKMRIC